MYIYIYTHIIDLCIKVNIYSYMYNSNNIVHTDKFASTDTYICMLI